MFHNEHGNEFCLGVCWNFFSKKTPTYTQTKHIYRKTKGVILKMPVLETDFLGFGFGYSNFEQIGFFGMEREMLFFMLQCCGQNFPIEDMENLLAFVEIS